VFGEEYSTSHGSDLPGAIRPSKRKENRVAYNGNTTTALERWWAEAKQLSRSAFTTVAGDGKEFSTGQTKQPGSVDHGVRKVIRPQSGYEKNGDGLGMLLECPEREGKKEPV